MTCYIARGWVLACPVYLFYDSPIDSPQAAPELMARHPALEWWLSGMLALVRLFWAPSTLLGAQRVPLPIPVTAEMEIDPDDLERLDDD